MRQREIARTEAAGAPDLHPDTIAMRARREPIQVLQGTMRRVIRTPGVLATDRVPAIRIQIDIPEVPAHQAEVTGALPGLRVRIGVREAVVPQEA